MSDTENKMDDVVNLIRDVHVLNSGIKPCKPLENDAIGKPKLNKYQREIKGAILDIYDILDAYDVRNPAIAHAIKKLLMNGNRGHKSIIQDYEEAIYSIDRGIELEESK